MDVVEYVEGKTQVNVVKSLRHPDEFFDIKACPHNASQFLGETGVVRDGRPGRVVSIFAIPEGGSEMVSIVQELGWRECEGKSIFWESRENVVVSSSSELTVYRVEGGTGVGVASRSLKTNACTGAVADPHHPFSIAFAEDRCLSLWDLRTKEASLSLKTSHFFPILSLDVNPNLEHTYVTGGADGQMMFWDLRQPAGSFPLKSVDAHAHHVTSVKFHPVHDQLVVSSGTDCAVKLWRMQSISSTPQKSPPLVETMSAKPSAQTSNRRVSMQGCILGDGLIQQNYRHEDSVYRVSWSGWTFASASVDGTVVFNTVPASEKYRIML